MERMFAVSAQGAPGAIQAYMEINYEPGNTDEDWTPGGGSHVILLVTSPCETRPWQNGTNIGLMNRGPDDSKQEQKIQQCPKPSTCIQPTNTWRSPESFKIHANLKGFFKPKMYSYVTYFRGVDFQCTLKVYNFVSHILTIIWCVFYDLTDMCAFFESLIDDFMTSLFYGYWFSDDCMFTASLLSEACSPLCIPCDPPRWIPFHHLGDVTWLWRDSLHREGNHEVFYFPLYFILQYGL